jgi:hypothetical protein
VDLHRRASRHRPSVRAATRPVAMSSIPRILPMTASMRVASPPSVDAEPLAQCVYHVGRIQANANKCFGPERRSIPSGPAIRVPFGTSNRKGSYQGTVTSSGANPSAVTVTLSPAARSLIVQTWPASILCSEIVLSLLLAWNATLR